MKRVPTVTAPLTLALGPTKEIYGMAASGVTPGSYTSADITVDAFGRVTAAANGAGGGGDTAVYTTTWDPADKSANITLSSGNLVATKTAAGDAHSMVRATHARFAGKWYWEIVVTTDDGNKNNMISLASPQDATTAGAYAGSTAVAGGGMSYYGATGELFRGSLTLATYATFAVGDVIGVAYDADSGYLDFSKNNIWLRRDPATGKLAMMGGVYKGFFPAASIYKGSSVASLTGRFARASFTGTIPTGFAPFDND